VVGVLIVGVVIGGLFWFDCVLLGWVCVWLLVSKELLVSIESL
jgi:hypothetical protein